MKFPMMPRHVGGLVACLFIEAAHASLFMTSRNTSAWRNHRIALVQQPTQGDAIVTPIAESFNAPCSCDCCMVIPRAKNEVVTFTRADGSDLSLNVKCAPATEETTQDSAEARCPLTCKASNADSVITASVSTMDLSRYCTYKCRPAMETVGSQCVRLTQKENAQMQDPTGNGVGDQPVEMADAEVVAPKQKLEAPGPAAAAAPAPAPPPPEGEDESAHVRWDLRKVIAQRLRAEAGADMARAAATEQRIRADRYATDKDKELAEYAKTALTPVSGKGQEAQVATEAEAKTASDELVIAQTHEREAAVESLKVVPDVKKQIKGAIKEAAWAAAKEEAAADAYMAAWDKPDNWGKTLAVRAATPYLQEMVNAITRVSEYEGFSKGLLAQAKGAQGQAQTLVLHANQYEAQGDHLGAATEEKKIKILINKAQTLEEEANKYWKIADDVRKSIPEWQMGGNMAAARAAWEFKVAFTPPPESFIQMGYR